MMGVIVPTVEGGRLGIMLDDQSNRITAIDPSARAFDAGLRVGDLVVAVDDTLITQLDGRSVVCRHPPPIDPTRPSVALTVLRLPEELMQRVLAGESLMNLASGGPAASVGMSEAEAEAEAHRNYPWAKEFITADGELKTLYNIKRGTVLQPMPQVQPSLAASKRKEAFANPRNGASTNILRLG